MDWDLTWRLALMGLFIAAMLYSLWWYCPRWLQALRRSEPRPKTTLRYGRITSKQELPPLVFPDEYYDPQPTSPPQSEASTGRGSGQSERPFVNHTGAPGQPGWQEKGD